MAGITLNTAKLSGVIIPAPEAKVLEYLGKRAAWMRMLLWGAHWIGSAIWLKNIVWLQLNLKFADRIMGGMNSFPLNTEL